MNPLAFANPGFNDLRLLFEWAPPGVEAAVMTTLVIGCIAVGGVLAFAGATTFVASRRAVVAGGPTPTSAEKDSRDLVMIAGVVGALLFLLGVARSIQVIVGLF